MDRFFLHDGRYFCPATSFVVFTSVLYICLPYRLSWVLGVDEIGGWFGLVRGREGKGTWREGWRMRPTEEMFARRYSGS